MIKILVEGADEAGAFNYYDVSSEYGSPKTLKEAKEALELPWAKADPDAKFVIVDVLHGELKEGLEEEEEEEDL